MDLINEIIQAIQDFFTSLFHTAETFTVGIKDQVRDAIIKGIVTPLQLPDGAADVLVAQSDVETGGWTSLAFVNTDSLFNRHVGSGRGEWKSDSPAYYASYADPDLRTYTDIYQSARDMAQLLTDPLYRNALYALRQNDSQGYADALQAAGFAANPEYAQLIKEKYLSYA